MMGIIQVSFLGLMMFDYHDPIIGALSFLKYSNGFNDLYPNPKDVLPNKIYLLGCSYLVIDNLNIVALTIFLPFVVGMIFFIISKIKRRGKLAMLSYFRLCMGEWSMFFILFSLINFTASATFFFSHLELTS